MTDRGGPRRDALDDAIDRVVADMVVRHDDLQAAARWRARFEAGPPNRRVRLPWWAAPAAAAVMLALAFAWTAREIRPPRPAPRVAAPAAREPGPPAVAREAAASHPIDRRPPAAASLAVAAAPKPSARPPLVGLPPIEAIDPLAVERLRIADPPAASAVMEPLSIDAIQVAPLSIAAPE